MRIHLTFFTWMFCLLSNLTFTKNWEFGQQRKLASKKLENWNGNLPKVLRIGEEISFHLLGRGFKFKVNYNSVCNFPICSSAKTFIIFIQPGILISTIKIQPQHLNIRRFQIETLDYIFKKCSLEKNSETLNQLSVLWILLLIKTWKFVLKFWKWNVSWVMIASSKQIQ